MTREDIINRFTYHAPFGDQLKRYEELRRTARDYALMIDDLVPPCREKSLALTKLEQAVMYANAGIARNEKKS